MQVRPICTLPIPCQHFYKAEKLKKYLEKKGVNMSKNATAAERATEQLKLGISLRKHDKRAQILEETGYHTTTSYNLFNFYNHINDYSNPAISIL